VPPTFFNTKQAARSELGTVNPKKLKKRAMLQSIRKSEEAGRKPEELLDPNVEQQMLASAALTAGKTGVDPAQAMAQSQQQVNQLRKDRMIAHLGEKARLEEQASGLTSEGVAMQQQATASAIGAVGAVAQLASPSSSALNIIGDLGKTVLGREQEEEEPPIVS
jgi:hypothetical protein